MVSRLLVAGRHLAVHSLLLCLLSLLVFVPAASARNPYAIRDGHEGDPGDGVLEPAPVVDPKPTPGDDIFPVFIITMVPMGNNTFLPVFQFTGFSGTHRLNNSDYGFLPVQDGRWHRAP